MTFDKKTVRGIMLLLLYAIVLFFLLWNFSSVLKSLSWLLGIFMPLIIGLSAAFVINPLMGSFESLFRLWRSKPETRGSQGLYRGLAILCAFLVVFGVVTILMLIIMPEVTSTIGAFIASLPQYTDQFMLWVDRLPEELDVVKEFFAETPNWDKVVSSVTSFFTDGAGGTVVSGVLGATVSFFGGLWDVIFGLIISLYVLAQKEKIGRFFSRFVRAFFPEKAARRTFYVAGLSSDAFSSFVSGQLIEAVIIGLLCYVGMLIFGFPYALTIGTIVSFTALIPVFGAWIGAILGALLILTRSPVSALWFLVFLVVLQQLEGNLIYPRVVGKTVGLPGLLVMLAVWVGASVNGVVGMLLAVPLCSIIYTLLKEAMASRLGESPAHSPAPEAGGPA